MKNIILCGFMGCGKSTIGKRLGEKLHRVFVDTDTYIEEKTGMEIKEYFNCFGEEQFRKEELLVAKALSGSSDLIIATGGGMFMRNDAVEALRENGKIIFLDTSLWEIGNRLKNDGSRPLLNRKNGELEIERLYFARYPKYQKIADLTVFCDDRDTDEICEEIIAWFQKEQDPQPQKL